MYSDGVGGGGKDVDTRSEKDGPPLVMGWSQYIQSYSVVDKNAIVCSLFATFSAS